jgi:hypothetical protein
MVEVLNEKAAKYDLQGQLETVDLYAMERRGSGMLHVMLSLLLKEVGFDVAEELGRITRVGGHRSGPRNRGDGDAGDDTGAGAEPVSAGRKAKAARVAKAFATTTRKKRKPAAVGTKGRKAAKR